MFYKFFSLLGICLFISTQILAQDYTISGRVISEKGNGISHAIIQIAPSHKRIEMNHKGFFSFTLPQGEYTLKVKAAGFDSTSQKINVTHDISNLSFSLKNNGALDAVEIRSKRTPEKLDEITRIPLDLHDQLQTISIVSAKVIEEQGALTVSEAAHNVPGVYTFATYGNKRESMGARGFRGIPVLKNGVRVHSDFRGQGILTDMEGIASMQVLRGSAAITQGIATDLGSPGGVINLVTKTPKFHKSGTVGLRLNSFGQVRATFDVYSPVNQSKTLAFRIDGAAEMGKSYRKGINNERFYINPSLLWKLGKKTTVIAEMDFLLDGRTPDLGTVNLGPGSVNAIYKLPYDQFLGFKNDRSNTLNATYSVRFSHQLKHNLKINAAVYHSSLSLLDKGASLGAVIMNDTIPVYNQRVRGYNASTREDKNTVVQFDLIGEEMHTGFVKHTFQIGVDMQLSNYTTTSQSVTAVDTIDVYRSNTNTLPTITLPTAKIAGARSTSMGMTAQDMLTFTKWFKVFVGARISFTEVINSVENSTSFAANPIGGLIFSPIPNINIFGSYTNSSYPRTASQLSVDGKPLGNERFDQIEAGVKSYWFDKRFSANVTYFRINNKNINMPIYDENWVPTGFYERGGNDRRQGVEVELTGHILKSLELIAGYSYLDARYLEHTKYVEGSSPLNTPKHIANFYVNYTFLKTAVKGLNIGLGVYYIGKRPDNEWSKVPNPGEGVVAGQKPFDINAYTQLNAYIGYNLKNHWRFRVIANNLLNQIGYNAYRSKYINQTDPLNFNLQVLYKF